MSSRCGGEASRAAVEVLCGLTGENPNLDMAKKLRMCARLLAFNVI